MTVHKEFNFGSNNRSPFGSFGPLIGLIVTSVILYFVIRGLFSLLTMLAPFLLIGAAILDYTVITDFIKFILKMLKENPLLGLVAIFLTIIGFPAVFGYLFFKAWARRSINKKINEIKKEQQHFDDYEEVDHTQNKAKDEEDFLKLPDMERPKPKDTDSTYDDLFNR